MQITVYSKPDCIQCRLTKRWLDQRGIAFVEADLLEPGNLEAARSLGVMSAPVVAAGSEVWGGFDPQRLAKATGVAA